MDNKNRLGGNNKLNRYFVFTLIIFLSSFPLEKAVIFADSKSMVVTFAQGRISYNYNGKRGKIKKGSIIHDRTLLSLDKKSLMEVLHRGKNIKLKITGPRIFRILSNQFEKSIKKKNSLYSLYAKVTRSQPHYYPFTVVLGVRKAGNKSSAGDEELNTKVLNKLKKMIKLTKDENYQLAMSLVIELESEKALNRHTQLLISYYKAEIQFQNLEFTQALKNFSATSRTRLRKFKHRERALFKAILCASFLEKSGLKKQLIQEYKDKYSASGQFYNTIISLPDSKK